VDLVVCYHPLPPSHCFHQRDGNVDELLALIGEERRVVGSGVKQVHWLFPTLVLHYRVAQLPQCLVSRVFEGVAAGSCPPQHIHAYLLGGHFALKVLIVIAVEYLGSSEALPSLPDRN
jgi:hypothetical protein